MSERSAREEIRVWQRGGGRRREEEGGGGRGKEEGGGGRTTGSELNVCDVSPPQTKRASSWCLSARIRGTRHTGCCSSGLTGLL